MGNEQTRAALARTRPATNGHNGTDPWQHGRPQQTAPPRRYENRSAQAAPVNVEPYVPPLDLEDPTGEVPSPFILVEGGEKVGKSWDLAVLSGSPRVGTSFWLDMSEGGAREYGAVPGARYKILRHDGTWRAIMGQIRAAHKFAGEAKERGDKPTCLMIDSGSLIWAGLSRWAEDKAKRSPAGQAVLRVNPDADVTVGMTQWNAANGRWREMMTLLQTFPGIVVMTARGKLVTAIGEDGKPAKNAPKEYRVEGQKDLCFDATAWVRKNRDGSTSVIGCRSVHAGIRPGKDDPKNLPEDGFTLDWFVFDVLKYDPARAHERDLKHLNGDVGEAHEESELAKARAAAVPGGSRLVDPDPNERAAGAHPGIRPGESGDHENTPPGADVPPFDIPDAAATDTTATGGEEDGFEFAMWCGDVVADTSNNRAAIRALWETGVGNGWLDRPMPGGDQSITGRVFMSRRAAALAATKEAAPA